MDYGMYTYRNTEIQNMKITEHIPNTDYYTFMNKYIIYYLNVRKYITEEQANALTHTHTHRPTRNPGKYLIAA